MLVSLAQEPTYLDRSHLKRRCGSRFSGSLEDVKVLVSQAMLVSLAREPTYLAKFLHHRGGDAQLWFSTICLPSTRYPNVSLTVRPVGGQADFSRKPNHSDHSSTETKTEGRTAACVRRRGP
jgi:hypothetical protein